MTDIQKIFDVGRDPLLVFLAKHAQETDFSMGITLNLPGATVSGDLVGRDKWVETVAARLAEAGGGELGEGLMIAYQQIDLEQIEDDETRYSFLHMINARFIGGDGLSPRGEGMLWRGRTYEVCGWSLGRLSAV